MSAFSNPSITSDSFVLQLTLPPNSPAVPGIEPAPDVPAGINSVRFLSAITTALSSSGIFPSRSPVAYDLIVAPSGSLTSTTVQFRMFKDTFGFPLPLIGGATFSQSSPFRVNLVSVPTGSAGQGLWIANVDVTNSASLSVISYF